MVNEEVVVDKLRHVNQYTDDLREMRGMSKDEYLADMVTQRAVERTFMNLIQSCIDLAQHVRSTEDFAPSGYVEKGDRGPRERRHPIERDAGEDGRGRGVPKRPRPPIR